MRKTTIRAACLEDVLDGVPPLRKITCASTCCKLCEEFARRTQVSKRWVCGVYTPICAKALAGTRCSGDETKGICGSYKVKEEP